MKNYLLKFFNSKILYIAIILFFIALIYYLFSFDVIAGDDIDFIFSKGTFKETLIDCNQGRFLNHYQDISVSYISNLLHCHPNQIVNTIFAFTRALDIVLFAILFSLFPFLTKNDNQTKIPFFWKIFITIFMVFYYFNLIEIRGCIEEFRHIDNHYAYSFGGLLYFYFIYIIGKLSFADKKFSLFHFILYIITSFFAALTNVTNIPGMIFLYLTYYFLFHQYTNIE